MTYLGSNRMILDPFMHHQTGEDYLGTFGSNVQISGMAKVKRVINRFQNTIDTIDKNEFSEHHLEWLQQDGYHVVTITGAERVVTQEELMGNQIWLETRYQGRTIEFYFAHLGSVFVKEGDLVTSTTVLATEGNTGLVLSSQELSDPTYGSHLHFAVYENGLLIDPRGYASFDQVISYPTGGEEPDETKWQVETESPLYQLPSTSSKQLGTVYPGEFYTILSKQKVESFFWFEIEVAGSKGYVASEQASVVPKEEDSQEPSSKEEQPLFVCPKDGYYYVKLKKGELLYLKKEEQSK